MSNILGCSASPSNMKTGVIIFVFVALAVLHQDTWNWDNGNLVFGFIPVGLAYHACYSMVAAIFWGWVVKFAWPDRMEKWAEGDD